MELPVKEGCGPVTGLVGVVGNAAAVQKWRSRQSRGTGQRSAAGWVESCDAGTATGSEGGSGSVGDGAVAAAAAVAAGGAAATAGAAASAGAGSSVMR